MALPSLFKIPAYRKFTFKTRYYDADKEELLERVERVKREIGVSKAVDDQGKYVQNIKGQMRKHLDSPIRPVRERTEKISNVRLFMIIVVLSAIAYYLFY